MSMIMCLALAVVFLYAAPTAAAGTCSGITCGYGGNCVAGPNKYSCVGCRSGYAGGDNKQCTVNPAPLKVHPKLKPMDLGKRFKPRGGILNKLYKKIPSDLTKCVAKDCDMCSKKDQKVCVLCNDKTFLDNKLCVSSCPSKTYNTNTPRGGRICKSCATADKRECTGRCTGFRWENKCIEGCILPNFSISYQANTCKPGDTLSKGSSCEVKCATGAVKLGSSELKYTCTSTGVMTMPSAKCQTPWDIYAEREGNNLGFLRASFVTDWSLTSCSDAKGFKKLKKSVDKEFDIVAPAIAALLGSNHQSDFSPSCHKGTNFNKLPKFALVSTKAYTLHSGALSIKEPVFYFNNIGPRRTKWSTSMQSKGSFLTQDGTTLTATIVGTYKPKAKSWTLTWLADGKWSAPFKVSWLAVTETAAIAKVSAANVTSLNLTGTCIASLPKQYSQRCTMDLLAKQWLLTVPFHPDVGLLQHFVAKHSPMSVSDLDVLTYLDPHGVMTMYLAETPQRVGKEQIGEGVTLLTKTKFPQTGPLTKLAAGLRVTHTSFFTQFTVGHFANSPAKAMLTFSSASNHTLTKYWVVSNLGFATDLQAAKFDLKLTGKMIAQFGSGKLAMDITGTISKNSVPTQVHAVAARWSDYYGMVGLDLVDIVAVCNLADTALSMTAKLPLGDVKIPMTGYIPPQMTSKVYLTGSVAKLTVKQLRAWMGGVTNAKSVVSDASDAIVFPNNEVTMSSRTGHMIPPWGKGKTVQMRRGLVIKTTSTLAGLPTTATITYNSNKIKTAAMYVSFDFASVNAMILANDKKLRDAVASKFALNFNDAAHNDLVSALRLKDVQTLVPIPEELEIAPWSIAQKTGVVSLEIEWQKQELLYHLPATFATQQSSTLVTDLLSMLKFGCRTSNDCKATGKATDVCSHVFSEGKYDASLSTWSCLSTCRKNEYKVKDAGCFVARQPGETCWSDASCTTLFCPKGVCVVKKNTGDTCNPSVPEACDSKYCCTLCGNICEEYPLKEGYNCTKDKDCKSGWCKSGVCSQLLKKGAACNENANCLSKYCSVPQNNKCTTQSNEGGSCFFADECVAGVKCCFECRFTCQKYPRKDGLGCATNNDCQSKFCFGSTCVKEIPDGGKCTADKLCQSQYCSTKQNNICVRKADNGGACKLDDDCKSDHCSVKQGNKCFTLIANGEKCGNDYECESGFCNDFDKDGKVIADKSKWECAKKLDKDVGCADNRQCKSNKCDVCQWWVCTCS